MGRPLNLKLIIDTYRNLNTKKRRCIDIGSQQTRQQNWETPRVIERVGKCSGAAAKKAEALTLHTCTEIRLSPWTTHGSVPDPQKPQRVPLILSYALSFKLLSISTLDTLFLHLLSICAFHTHPCVLEPGSANFANRLFSFLLD